MKARKFRIGQTVQSIYDPTHTFVIDQSRIPEPVYHEKGSNRWWTQNELQRLGSPENPIASFRLNGKEEMRVMHSNAFRANANKLVREPGGAELRKCMLADCGVNFRPKRPWQKFHSETCRLAYWKRGTSPMSEGDKSLGAIHRQGCDGAQAGRRQGVP
jgi:hypothetical protein